MSTFVAHHFPSTDTMPAVKTPITQALADGVLSRRELKGFMQRSNAPAFFHLFAWLATLLASGLLVSFCMHTWWLFPAMFVHGVVLVHHFSLQHECVHYTAFKTRWLNDLVGNICGLIIILPNRFFRYEHCDHHTYTQLTGRDPELIPMPDSFSQYLIYLSSWPYWKAKISELIAHVAGRLSPVERRFIPVEEHQTVFWEARLMLAFYLAIASLCVLADWWAPLWYWWLPVLLGEPFMRAVRMTEHVGRPTTNNMRENTRTNLVSAPMRFLCWNMNYHAEHHYASSVPFFALPKFHEKLNGYVYVEKRGYVGAHRDIIARLRGRAL